MSEDGKEVQQFYIDLGDDVFSNSLQLFEEEEDMKLRLIVDNVPFSELPLAPEEFIVHRTPIINNFMGRKKYTKVVISDQMAIS